MVRYHTLCRVLMRKRKEFMVYTEAEQIQSRTAGLKIVILKVGWSMILVVAVVVVVVVILGGGFV
jgi:hypothetical protein